MSVASVVWLFRMGLGLTMLVIGLVFLGVLGTWRLATLYPSNRARIAARLAREVDVCLVDRGPLDAASRKSIGGSLHLKS